MPTIMLAALFVVLTACPSVAHAAGAFASAATVGMQGQVAVADFDGDGIPDIAASGGVRLGVGDGTFGSLLPFVSMGTTMGIATGDVDGDDVLDLLLANANDGVVAVFLGNGDGTFAVRTDFALGHSPRHIAVGDLDGDGALDVVTATEGSVAVLLGAGDGTFGAPTMLVLDASHVRALAIVDVNGDGLPDLVTVNAAVSVRPGVGDGTFGPSIETVLPGPPMEAAVGDLNGDGVPDVVAAAIGPNRVVVLLGDGDGTFTLQPVFAGPPGAYRSLVLADVDDDGLADVLLHSWLNCGLDVDCPQYLSVWYGAPAGLLSTQAAAFAAGAERDGFGNLGIGDLDGDGARDVVVPGMSGRVLLNVAAAIYFDHTTFDRSARRFSLYESSGSMTLTVRRAGGRSTSMAVSYATTDETAIAGEDYVTTSGVLTFAPGESTKTITVPIVNDTAAEPEETLTVTLSGATGGAAVGLAGSATVSVTIFASDTPQVRFSAPVYDTTEGVGRQVVTVVRSGLGTAVSVVVGTVGGTAVAGRHYRAVTKTLTFGPLERRKTFSVPILNDSVGEAPRNVILRLTNPVGAAVGADAEIRIVDDDTQVRFAAPTYAVREIEGHATIAVARVGRADTTVSVRYATYDRTAGRADYTPTSGILTFAAGEMTGTFTVPITNDTRTEGKETIGLVLSSPGAGATLGTPSEAVLTIAASDTPYVRFSAAGYSVGEAAGSTTITVVRGGGLGTMVTVRYATSDGTARAGLDYVATSGLLTFGPAESTRTFTVQILNDGRTEPTETIGLQLSDPGGARLRDPATATLGITAND